MARSYVNRAPAATDAPAPSSRPVVVGVVLFEDEEHPPGLDAVGADADVRIARSAADVAAMGREVEVLFVWQFRDDLLRQAWDRLDRLRWVHTASAGVDAVVFPELVEQDVVVTNSRGVLDGAIAEWVLGVMLLFVKDLHTTLAHQRQARWEHRESQRLAGRRAVVVGAGSVGRAIARLCRAAGMTVDGIARSPRSDDPDFGRVDGPAGLHASLEGADFVVVATPLTDATRGLIGPRELAALAPGARLVNVGRGPVVDERALLDALRSGRLAGAALDVFDEEPLPADHPFWAMPQVVVSPHMSGDFEGWRGAFTELFVDNFGRYRRGEPLRNQVDLRAVVASLGPAPG